MRELEAVQHLILRILSTTKPLGSELDQYGATATQEREFYAYTVTQHWPTGA